MPAAESWPAGIAFSAAMDSRIHTRFPCWIPESIAAVGLLSLMNPRIHRGLAD
jgi:hypothetical protein